MRLWRAKASESQKLKVIEYDRKRAAAKRLEDKVKLGQKRCNAAERKRKSRDSQLVPCTERGFKKHVKQLLFVAQKSPSKVDYLQKTVGTLDSLAGPKRYSLLQMKSFKMQNRVQDHKRLVDKMIADYGSKRKASLALNVPWPTFHRLCKPPVKKIKTVRETWKQVRQFFETGLASIELPGGRSSGKRYLNKTLEETFTIYKNACLQKKLAPVGLSTFCRLRPKYIYKLANTPDRQCICDQCENFRLIRQACHDIGIIGIESHTDACIKQSLCEVLNKDRVEADSNADSNDSNGLKQVDPMYGYLNCINRHCDKCGPEFVLLEIIAKNTDLKSKVPVKWKRWQWVTKPGSKPGTVLRRLDLVTIHGTKEDLLKQYAAELKFMSFHLFSCNWNYAQFVHIKETLKPGQLLQVLDFGQNYMNVFQDEPQSVHWDHTQTVIHPIVCYYRDKNGRLVTEEHIMISDDLKHDKFAVKAFEKRCLQHLKNKGFVPRQIIQFCDNCAGQYKSKGPFQFISAAGIPTIRMFFGARHGKGPADGAVGRIKRGVTLSIKARQTVIRNAEEFYEFCLTKFEKNHYREEEGQVFLQEFFYVTDIERTEDIVAVTCVHTRSFYSIRSTGSYCSIEVREVSCCCESCLDGDGSTCPNQAYASKWRVLNLRTGKPLVSESFKNTHWGLTVNNDNAEATDKADFDHTPNVFDSDDEELPTYLGFNWGQVFAKFQEKKNYFELEEYVLSIEENHMMNLRIQKMPRNAAVDEVALQSIPKDGPAGLHPVSILGDGNCFSRSVSTALYGTENFHQEIRTKIVVESIKNKNHYLDESYLQCGTDFCNDHNTFAEMYATWSGQYVEDDSGFADLVEMIFEREIFDISRTRVHMGMWQMWAACNVIGRPICSVFPERGSNKFRPNFHRMLVPIDVSMRRKQPLNIMWTPVVPNGNINHFVPLLRK